MAYVLGFFAADGNMMKSKRGNHYISFYSTDHHIIKDIRERLGSNHKIGVRVSANLKWRDMYNLQIGSKEMFNDLLVLGMTPNKSKTLKFPCIPELYFNDFLRGYFDGDGHVSWGIYPRKNRPTLQKALIVGFTSGSYEFLADLHIALKNKDIVNKGSLFTKKSSYSCLQFSKSDSLSIYDCLYKTPSSGLYLPRKKKVFDQFISLRV